VTVKDKVGRNRYIVFRVEAGRGVGRAEVEEALRSAGASVAPEDRPRLVLWRSGLGLARCRHTAKDPTIALLTGLTAIGGQAATVRTLGTSGTIRRARKKWMESPARDRRA
jgi:ribonuclease P/MRP protein subunit POP5